MTPQQLTLTPDLAAPLWQHDAPETSQQPPSAEHRTLHQQAVLEQHREYPAGLTDAELVALLPEYLPASTVKRASELRAAGVLVDSGTRRLTPSGRSACVWQVT